MNTSNESHEPSDNFDNFLAESEERLRAKQVAEGLHDTFEGILTQRLRDQGVLLIAGVSDKEAQQSIDTLIDPTTAILQDKCYQTYITNPSLQNRMSFEEYLALSVKNHIHFIIQVQSSLIGAAIKIMSSAEAQSLTDAHNGDKNSAWKKVSHEKKKLIAYRIARGDFQADDEWFDTFNDIIPGEILDLNSEEGRSYLIDGLARYTQEESIRKLFERMNIEITRIATRAFGSSPDAQTKIDNALLTVPRFLQNYRHDPIAIEALIDEYSRRYTAPSTFTLEIKNLAVSFSHEMETEISKLPKD